MDTANQTNGDCHGSTNNPVDTANQADINCQNGMNDPVDSGKHVDTVAQSSKGKQSKTKKRLEIIATIRVEEIVREIPIAMSMLQAVGLSDINEYALLERLLNDQTKLDEEGKRIAKDKTEIKGTSLQNPYEPDATSRTKNYHHFKGFSAFFAEKIFQDGHGIIVERYFGSNTCSDQEFAKRFYESFPECSEIKIAACTDALFTSHALNLLARSRGISIFCASVTGKPPDIILAEYKFDDSGTTIIECPCGNKPKQSSFRENDGGIISIKFGTNCCKDCQHSIACHARTGVREKSSASIRLNQVVSARNILMLKDHRFHAMINKRNGVEGIPSVFRRKYHIDDIPYFGLQYGANFFYTINTAYNTIKYYAYYRNL